MPECPGPDNNDGFLECRVLPEHRGQRLDLFLSRQTTGQGLSRTRIKELILQGQASINGKTVLLPRHKLIPGQIVTLSIPQNTESELEAQQGELTVIHHEKNFLVLNKPPGLTVHPCPSCPKDTLVNILLHQFPELGKIPGLRPGIVHRLDKDTSGILLAALNEPTRLKLSESFSARTVSKEYLALVKGVPAGQHGVINEPIGRHPANKTKMAVTPGGKEAISEYRILAEGAGFSLLAVKIHTGRTHQIRVHLAHIGHPIWGDRTYGGPTFRTVTNSQKERKTGTKIASRQMLHAWKLEFQNPDNNEVLAFTCPPPADFTAAVGALVTSPLKVVITGLPGSGKSSLLKELGLCGLPTWSADAEVSKLYARGADGWQMIKGRFGDRFVDVNGNIDKANLFTSMQTEPGLRREIEEMIHPAVKHGLDFFWQQTEQETPQPPCMAAEVPLFLESGWNKTPFNWGELWRKELEAHANAGFKSNSDLQPGDIILIYVDAPRSLRYERMRQKGVDEEKAAILDSWQLPEDKKKNACNIIIDNSKGLSELKKTTEILYRLLVCLAEARRKRAVQMVMGSLIY